MIVLPYIQKTEQSRTVYKYYMIIMSERSRKKSTPLTLKGRKEEVLAASSSSSFQIRGQF